MFSLAPSALRSVGIDHREVIFFAVVGSEFLILLVVNFVPILCTCQNNILTF